MSEWRETKLGNYIESISETYKFKPNEQVVFLNTSDILLGKVLNHTLEDSGNLPGQAKKRIMKNDFLFSEIRPANGRYALIDFDADKYVVSTKLMVLRCNSKVDVNYIRLYLTSKKLLEYLQMLAEDRSGTFPQITFHHISTLEIKLPPLPEQKAIAEVLSSLDDKIDLLHRQNKTLEQMAETLFRQWFVEEAGEDWEYVALEEFVSCYNGVSYKSADLNPSETAMVTLKSFARDGEFRLDGFKEYTGKYKKTHIVKPGDLAVAHTDITQDAAIVGNPVLIIGKEEYTTLVVSMDLVKVESKKDWVSNEFIYFLMKTRLFKQHCLGYANGSTVLHLSKKAIPDFEFFLPPVEQIKLFTKQAQNLLGKKNKNIYQIRTLEKLRDTLLPKLMSGEVRVN